MDTAPNAMPRELVMTREFDAPRELVFRAWTDPECFAQWWGPHHFTIPHCTIDPRVGGRVHYCMRSPDGHDFWGGGEFREIAPPERLVFTEYFSDAEGNHVPRTAIGFSPEWPDPALITVTFEDLNGRTRLTVHTGVAEAIAETVRASVGWGQSFDKLAAFLAAQAGV